MWYNIFDKVKRRDKVKKKILLSLIVIVALFTITGCGKSDNKESYNAAKNDEVVNK